MGNAIFKHWQTTAVGAAIAALTAYQALGPGIARGQAVLQVLGAIGLFLAHDGRPAASQ